MPEPTSPATAAWLATVTLTDALRQGEVKITDRDDVIWQHVQRKIEGTPRVQEAKRD